MSLSNQVTKKEFAREILIGSLAVSCLFAILLFVAIQRATGRSLSPLAYLFNTADDDMPIPVPVFQKDQDRQDALMESPAHIPGGQPLAGQKQRPVKPWDLKSDEDSQIESSRLEIVSRTENVSRWNRRTPVNRMTSHLETSQLGDSSGVLQTDFHSPDRVALEMPSHDSFQPVTPPSSAEEFLDLANDEKPPLLLLNSEVQPIRSPASKAAPELASAVRLQQSLDHGESNRLKDVENRKIHVPISPVSSHQPELRRVHPNSSDSFWTISKREYGDGKYFRLLAGFNSCFHDSMVLPDVVLVPRIDLLLRRSQSPQTERFSNSVSLLSRQVPPVKRRVASTQSKRIHTVKAGETLFMIATEQLGQGSRFIELIQMNPGKVPAQFDGQTALSAGTKLRLPRGQ